MTAIIEKILHGGPTKGFEIVLPLKSHRQAFDSLHLGIVQHLDAQLPLQPSAQVRQRLVKRSVFRGRRQKLKIDSHAATRLGWGKRTIPQIKKEIRKRCHFHPRQRREDRIQLKIVCHAALFIATDSQLQVESQGKKTAPGICRERCDKT